MPLALLPGMLSIIILGQLIQGALSPASVQWTFENEALGGIPSGWTSRGRSPEGLYWVAAEGNNNRYLAASSQSNGVQLGFELTPGAVEPLVLSWRWRVWEVPRGADERRIERLDSAASVYAVFGSRFAPRVLKYVWSTSLPCGERVFHPHSDRVAFVVVGSGERGLGEWHEVTRDVTADARAIWRRDPGPLRALGVKTDSDSTKSSARADYDDFVLRYSQPLEKGGER